MDLQAIYPPAMVPSFMKSIKAYYIETYKDKFFVDSPDFFKAFIWSELLIQAPVMIWAISALLRSMFPSRDQWNYPLNTDTL